MTQTPNHIGDTIWYALALPATNNKEGFEALTWVEAVGHQTLPQFGITHAMIEVKDLKTGFTAASKGAAQGVDTTMAFRGISGSTAQAALQETADDNDGEISLKVVKGSGPKNAPATGDPVKYAQGILHSNQPNKGDDTTHEGFSVNFRQNDFTIEDVHPTVA